VLGLVALAIGMTACGRRGPLEPPALGSAFAPASTAVAMAAAEQPVRDPLRI
jgi:predicted small lipoprotein YifL